MNLVSLKVALPIVAAFMICALSASATPAMADFDGPGFLQFARGNSIAKKSEEITVQVGLFDSEGTKPTPDQNVWFYARFQKKHWTDPIRFRWADGARCPAALAMLKQIKTVDMPTPVLPIQPRDESDGDIILDGRNYSLDVDASSVNGQLSSGMHVETNVDTDISKWIDHMIDALEPCWSTTVPEGVNETAGRGNWIPKAE